MCMMQIFCADHITSSPYSKNASVCGRAGRDVCVHAEIHSVIRIIIIRVIMFMRVTRVIRIIRVITLFRGFRIIRVYWG